MINKNKTIYSAKETIFRPKGFNFSSLYQNAYFSSQPINKKEVTSLEAKAISQNFLASTSNTFLRESIVAKGLGPILNTKLLNYNFLSNTTIATPSNTNNAINKNLGIRAVYSEDIIKLISAFFKSIYCLISRPKFINTPDKIIIEILYYITIPDHNIFKWYNFIYSNNQGTTSYNNKGNINKNKKKPTIKTILNKNIILKKTLFKLNNSNIVNLYLNKFAILFKLLQLPQNPNKIINKAIINKPIEFNLIRIHKSDYDSNILAQLFILILKKKNIRIAINKLYNKNTTHSSFKMNKASHVNPANIWQYTFPYLPSAIAYISGLYIKIGGRLMREPIIPRLTTKNFELGAIATGKVQYVDSARITKKNKKGAYTIKITYAQNFVA